MLVDLASAIRSSGDSPGASGVKIDASGAGGGVLTGGIGGSVEGGGDGVDEGGGGGVGGAETGFEVDGGGGGVEGILAFSAVGGSPKTDSNNDPTLSACFVAELVFCKLPILDL